MIFSQILFERKQGLKKKEEEQDRELNKKKVKYAEDVVSAPQKW